MVQLEDGSAAAARSLPDRPRREDDDFPEHLLRQIPVFGRRPTADIGWIKQRRHQDPGIRHAMLGADEVERDRHIGARPNPLQPSLFRPRGQRFGRLDPRQAQGGGGVLQPHHVARLAEDVGKLRPAFGQRFWLEYIRHAQFLDLCEFVHLNYTIFRLTMQLKLC